MNPHRPVLIPSVHSRALLAAAFIGAPCTLALTGCEADNSRLAIGHQRLGSFVRIDAFDPTTELSFERSETRAAAPGPSFTPGAARMDRSGWNMPEAVVPTDGVHGFPAYANQFQKTHATARQRGEFPTPTTALDLAGETPKGQRREAYLSPVYAGLDALLLAPRMILNAPDSQTRHVPKQYARTPLDSGTARPAEPGRAGERRP